MDAVRAGEAMGWSRKALRGGGEHRRVCDIPLRKWLPSEQPTVQDETKEGWQLTAGEVSSQLPLS